jgi:hypothetical protein
MFNCRDLDGGLTVLLMDYSVHCSTVTHRFFQAIAIAVIAVVSLGCPIAMVVMMIRRIDEYRSGGASERFVARRVADELKLDDRVAADAIRDVSTGREYSFLVNAYKPRYYFWEGIDMVRKLLLVGMLVIAGRGSVAQLFLAVCVSCVSLMLQVNLAPYKHWEDNVLKTCVEVHLFLVVACALVLKCLGYKSSNELLGVSFYDGLLVLSFIACLPVAFVWTLSAKRSIMRDALRGNDAAAGQEAMMSVAAKQRAIRLLQLGLTTNEDLRLLASYFSKLENMVNKWSHVFISYRVASDRELARRLYDALSAMTVDETGSKMRVYLDQTRLEDGQRWDSGFMEGLAQSWVFIPIVSVGSVQPMTHLGAGEDWVDNVLLEWTAALELHQRGRLKSVLPLLVGEEDFFADAQESFGGISALPTCSSPATMEQVVTHLQEHTADAAVDGLNELLQQATGQREPTIQAVVSALLKFQGIKVSHSGVGTAHSHGHMSADSHDLRECTLRVQAAVSACLKRLGHTEEASPLVRGSAAAPRKSILGRLSSGGRRSPSGGGGGQDAMAAGAAIDGFGLGEDSGAPREGGGGLYLSSD